MITSCLADASELASAGGVGVVPGRARGPGPSAVAGSVAVVVGLGGASITVLVGATWGWARAAACEAEVAESEVWHVVAGARAGAVLEPGDTVISAPVAHDERHASVEDVAEATDVSVVHLRDVLLVSLGDSELV